MTFSIVVPARLASARLPNKALAPINDKPMILHVLEQARLTGAQRIVAATDSAEIASVVENAGFEVAMTGDCATGTERVAKAARDLSIDGIIINLQGDEPEMSPGLVVEVARRVGQGDCECASAMAPVAPQLATDPNVVKVVVNSCNHACLFTRATIPYHRDVEPDPQYLGHMGIYGFAHGLLAATLDLPECALEKTERLEQLRWLWHGWRIGMVRTDKFCHGIDTAADLEAARKRMAERPG